MPKTEHRLKNREYRFMMDMGQGVRKLNLCGFTGEALNY